MKTLPLLLLFPALAFGQVLHEFNNGDVADAEKINQNFQSLSSVIGSVAHPAGDLILTKADESSQTSLLFNERWAPAKTLLDINGSNYVVEDHPTDLIYVQQGIVFKVEGYVRQHPPVEVSNDICPEPQRAYPYESVWTFHNEHGTITMSTGSEYYVDGVVDPDRIPTLSSGDFYCEEDQTYWYTWKLEGATGRYKCAVNTKPDRTYPAGGCLSPGEIVTLDWKPAGERSWIGHCASRSEALLSLNIPMSCE